MEDRLMEIKWYDHRSDQHHRSVEGWLTRWCKEFGSKPAVYCGSPWDESNIPVQAWVTETEGFKLAEVLVFLPRKRLVKWVHIEIHTEEGEAWFKASFLGAAKVYRRAARSLKKYGEGAAKEDWALYYW
jgi:hypothetical protein